MLTLITPLRAVTALFILTIAIAVGTRSTPSRCGCPGRWSVGTVTSGSIHPDAGGYRLTVDRRGYGQPRVEVWHRGELDDAICDGALVYVSHDDDQVQGFHDGAYDGCWQQRCDRAAYDRCRESRHGDRDRPRLQ